MNIRESEFGPLPSYIFAVWLQLMELSAPAPGEWPAPAPWQVSSLQPLATLWARRTVELCVIKCAEIQIWLGNHPTRNLCTFYDTELNEQCVATKVVSILYNMSLVWKFEFEFGKDFFFLIGPHTAARPLHFREHTYQNSIRSSI